MTMRYSMRRKAKVAKSMNSALIDKTTSWFKVVGILHTFN